MHVAYLTQADDVVNYQGGDYSFINHSIWNGLTVRIFVVFRFRFLFLKFVDIDVDAQIADLVFPWFVFLMGVSITLSFSSTLARPPVDYASLLYKIVRRACILFVLGMLVNGCYELR